MSCERALVRLFILVCREIVVPTCQAPQEEMGLSQLLIKVRSNNGLIVFFICRLQNQLRLVQFLLLMLQRMSRQCTVRNEAHAANATDERLFSGVQPDVRSQRLGQAETLLAKGTLVRPLPNVTRSHVDVPIAGLGERLVANLTTVRLPLQMHPVNVHF